MKRMNPLDRRNLLDLRDLLEWYRKSAQRLMAPGAALEGGEASLSCADMILKTMENVK